MPTTRREDALQWWESVTQWPLIIAAVLFLAAFAVPIIWPDLMHPILNFTTEIIVGTWIAFAVDFVIRFILAIDKLKFFKANVIDFLSIALPILRPLRLLRVVAALSVFTRFGIQTLRGRVVMYVVSFTMLITFVGALAITQAERGAPGATVNSFGDGLWLAFVTVTTVGYGDFTPVTFAGRSADVMLMLLGVLLLGAISASLASWLVERNAIKETKYEVETNADVSSLLAQIENLNAQTTQLHLALEHHATLLKERQPVAEAWHPHLPHRRRAETRHAEVVAPAAAVSAPPQPGTPPQTSQVTEADPQSDKV
ncbi:MAG: potassium channel family protein [Promicromonosporaceae bacterium]|nr:potassium channel family protein [Promicromonosporaceae bacterium]